MCFTCPTPPNCKPSGGAEPLFRGGRPVRQLKTEKIHPQTQLIFMPYHRRRLPHLYEPGHPIFLTWRLHAQLTTDAIHHNSTILAHYTPVRAGLAATAATYQWSSATTLSPLSPVLSNASR
jgi:hypothetical protein